MCGGRVFSGESAKDLDGCPDSEQAGSTRRSTKDKDKTEACVEHFSSVAERLVWRTEMAERRVVVGGTRMSKETFILH